MKYVLRNQAKSLLTTVTISVMSVTFLAFQGIWFYQFDGLNCGELSDDKTVCKVQNSEVDMWVTARKGGKKDDYLTLSMRFQSKSQDTLRIELERFLGLLNGEEQQPLDFDVFGGAKKVSGKYIEFYNGKSELVVSFDGFKNVNQGSFQIVLGVLSAKNSSLLIDLGKIEVNLSKYIVTPSA